MTAPTAGETCPLPGCDNPAGTGKTRACCLGHASKLAWAVRAGRRLTAAPQPAPARPKTKQQVAAEEQRLRDRRNALAEGLRERERQVQAAYRARR